MPPPRAPASGLSGLVPGVLGLNEAYCNLGARALPLKEASAPGVLSRSYFRLHLMLSPNNGVLYLFLFDKHVECSRFYEGKNSRLNRSFKMPPPENS